MSRRSNPFLKDFGLNQVIKSTYVMGFEDGSTDISTEKNIQIDNCFQRFYIYNHKVGISGFKACLDWLLFQFSIYF